MRLFKMFEKVSVFLVLVSFFAWCDGSNYNSSGETCGLSFRWSREFRNSSEELEKLPENEINDIFQIWKDFSLFSMSNVDEISPECSSAVKEYVKGLKENDMSSMKMFDATGKLPSGILHGNVNQFGDFDECLSVEKAKYCLAEIDFEPNWRPQYTKYKNLVHSYFAIRETFDDVKHRVPGFSMVRWGFCIPKQCSPSDLEIALRTNHKIISRVKPEMCQISRTKALTEEVSYGETITRYLFGTIIFLTALATLRGFFLLNIEEENKILRMLDCFNLIDNWNNLTTLKQSNDDFKTIHGVRALGALALIISHKTMAMFYNPYINRSTMSENLGMRWSVIGRTAILYTDGFMMISGFLTAYSFFKDLDKMKTIKFGNKIVSRIMRILPNLIAIILFCTYILPQLGAGPLWPLVVDHHSQLCKKYMWRNMLFIHNFFPFQDMCLTHTHQLGIDMQLFLLTPIVVYVLWSSRKMGLILLGTITAASTILRFLVTWNNNLSHVVHFGITINRMFDTANLSYILPTHRATVYFMGVFLAYLMKDKSVIHFSKKQLGVYWSFFMLLGFGTWLGPMHMSHPGYVYNRLDAALYGALSPITFGSAVAWTIYATEKGYGGFFSFLAWDKFKYFTKIAYAVYLVQFPLFFFNVGKTKHADEFSISEMLQVTETLAVIAISIALTVFIEIPFQQLRTEFNQEKQLVGKKTQTTNNMKRTDVFQWFVRTIKI